MGLGTLENCLAHSMSHENYGATLGWNFFMKGMLHTGYSLSDQHINRKFDDWFCQTYEELHIVF